MNELDGQLVPDLENTAMLPSSRRADSEEVVNFHVSSYERGETVLAQDLNRSAVLAVSRSKFPDHENINKEKVRKLFQLELSQQLVSSERYEEMESIHTAANEGNLLGSLDGIPVLNVPAVEVDHLSLSLLTLAGKEKKMFMDEQKAMMSFHNQTDYYKLEIDGQVILVPAKFRVHLLNTGVAEISTRNLETSGFSLKSIIGTVVDLVTKMGKTQKSLNEKTSEVDEGCRSGEDGFK